MARACSRNPSRTTEITLPGRARRPVDPDPETPGARVRRRSAPHGPPGDELVPDQPVAHVVVGQASPAGPVGPDREHLVVPAEKALEDDPLAVGEPERPEGTAREDRKN